MLIFRRHGKITAIWMWPAQKRGLQTAPWSTKVKFLIRWFHTEPWASETRRTDFLRKLGLVDPRIMGGTR